MAETQQKNAFSWGGLLAVIKRDRLHEGLGYSGKRAWQTFIEEKMAGMDYRRAQYWLTIYETFTRAGLDERHVDKMGWSKAKEIARIARLKGAPDQLAGPDILIRDRDVLLQQAENLSRDELADYVRDAYMSKPEPSKLLEGPRVRTPIKTKLWPDQLRTFKRAIDAALKAANTEDEAMAMTLITTEWQMSHDGVEVPLEDAIRAMEMRYGVKVQTSENDEEEAA